MSTPNDRKGPDRKRISLPEKMVKLPTAPTCLVGAAVARGKRKRRQSK